MYSLGVKGCKNLLNVLPSVLLLQQANGGLDGLLADRAQLGHDASDLGGLQIVVGLRLDWLAGLGKPAYVLHDMANKTRKVGRA